MKLYDCIIVLASQPRDISDWKFPSHVFNSLDRAIELFNKKASPYIALSGKWAIRFDILHIQQPFRECDGMEKYLLEKGISQESILKEGDSKDTISNLYYLKNQIFKPRNMRKLLFIAAEFRTERVKFLCERILGPDYDVEVEGVGYLPEETYPHEDRTFKLQRDFLAPMKSGDDAWLNGKFFTASIYLQWSKILLSETPEKRITT